MASLSNAQLLNRVTYTASLASDPKAIDEMLDPVRGVTAVHSPDAFTPADINTLNSTQKNLEQYLTTKEKLRQFTPDSLQVQLDQFIQGKRTYTRSRWLLIALVLLAIVAGYGATLLPNAPEERFLLIRLIGFTVTAALHIGAAVLFLTALASFKSNLRKAFLVICAGLVLLGISLLIQPVSELFGLRNLPFGGILIASPLVVSAGIIYLGMVYFGRLVGARVATWPFFILAGVVALISFFAPHASQHEPELLRDLGAMLQGWVALFPLLSGLLPLKLKIKWQKFTKPQPKLWQLPG